MTTSQKRPPPPAGEPPPPPPDAAPGRGRGSALPRQGSLRWSFTWAFEGIVYVLRTQRNMQIHVSIAVVALVLGLLLEFSRVELALVIGAVSLVLVAEMMNTAVEAAIDAVVTTYHPIVKIAKDVSAGAVLVATANALAIGDDIVGKAKEGPVALQGGGGFGDGSPLGPELRRFFQGQGQDQCQAEPLRATGSGFFISADGYIVTNNHVVEGADKITVRTTDDRDAEGHADRPRPGHRPGGDQGRGRALPVCQLRGPRQAARRRLGGGGRQPLQPRRHGHGRHRLGAAAARTCRGSSYVDYMQIDAPINRGNSGGPTFDLYGRVVGVNTAIFSPSGGSVGIGFDIPADVAARSPGS